MNPLPTHSHLPRWRGFNLLEKFTAAHNSPYREEDFAAIAGWGFDFVRLPLSYRCWTETHNLLEMRESVLKEIDAAVEMGRRYGLHVNLNFHRAPGYCVNFPPEPLNLWRDEAALEACAWQWAQLARRYRGISSHQLSFNLLNEPPYDLDEAIYGRVARRLCEAIRGEDPDRPILADGLAHGNVPVPELVPLQIAQSTRGYTPMRISHYGANWVEHLGASKWGEPGWPLSEDEDDGCWDNDCWDKARLHRERIAPWQALQNQGVGVHVGEWGVFNRTPHTVALAWMRDCLDLWKAAGWGWALWNFRGTFGVLDSQRSDVRYEEWRGHQLDHQMLELLQTG